MKVRHNGCGGDVDPHNFTKLDCGQAVENYSMTYGGNNYDLDGEFRENGDIVVLRAVDPISGVVINVQTAEGVRSGTIKDAAGDTLGAIADNVDGKREITYADGSKQLL